VAAGQQIAFQPAGRHGLMSCYEAFIHIVDSMFNQHAKWLKVSRALPLCRVCEKTVDTQAR
jgi:phosphoketolase